VPEESEVAVPGMEELGDRRVADQLDDRPRIDRQRIDRRDLRLRRVPPGDLDQGQLRHVTRLGDELQVEREPPGRGQLRRQGGHVGGLREGGWHAAGAL
jgi:hypothetical protein